MCIVQRSDIQHNNIQVHNVRSKDNTVWQLIFFFKIALRLLSNELVDIFLIPTQSFYVFPYIPTFDYQKWWKLSINENQFDCFEGCVRARKASKSCDSSSSTLLKENQLSNTVICDKDNCQNEDILREKFWFTQSHNK